MSSNSVNSDSQNLPQVFPYIPPGDSIVKNELNISTLLENGTQNPDSTRFCAICDYPMLVKVVLVPCNHYMCYSCYCMSPNECRLCEQLIKEAKRLGDYDTFYACDNEKCYKFFESEQKLVVHAETHHL